MKQNRNWIKKLTLLSTAVALPAVGTAADVDPAVIEKLQKQVDALTREVQTLKEGPPVDEATKDALSANFLKGTGLNIGFYGEAKYRFPEDGNNRFDPHRFVLTPSYKITDWLIFNSEIELEHGAVDESSNSGRNRFDGELELEQFFVDILINEHFNIRSPGIDLVPVGRINKYHEPTVFYSTERPELYREIIPSTWFEPSMGVFGKVVENLDYQFMISTGLEDAVATPGSARTSTRPPGFAGPGFDGASGPRNARPRLRATSENDLAYSGRLHYNGIEGLDTSASFYITTVEGLFGQSFVGLWDIEALYRVPRTGLELRADFAYWHLGHPENFVANNNLSTTDDVGNRMYGWYLEAAYHFWPEAWKTGKGSDMDLVPFVRFSQIATQSGLETGNRQVTDGTRDKDFLTAGMSYFLNRNFVLKADWRRNFTESEAKRNDGNAQDYFQFGAGVFF